VVRVFSKSKPTQSKRQTQWQVWIWAVSSLRSPIQSNPNLFVNIFRKVFIAIVGVDRRPIDVVLGRESGLAQGSIICSIIEISPNTSRNSVDFEPSLGTCEPEIVRTRRGIKRSPGS
jgi:hypothetical protein